MRVKCLLAASLLFIIVITGGFSGCSPALNGALPQFAIGDQWVSSWHIGGVAYTVTSTITGEETIGGKNCWVMETVYDPPYLNSVVSTTNKYEKTNLDIVSVYYHTNQPGEFTSITFQVCGTPYYPLSVGKESQEIDFQTIATGNATISSTQNSTITFTTKVEKIETITVKAGTFQCFKVLKYDDQGNLLQTAWRSDKTKLFQVKMTDPADENAVYELVSYAVK